LFGAFSCIRNINLSYAPLSVFRIYPTKNRNMMDAVLTLTDHSDLLKAFNARNFTGDSVQAYVLWEQFL
jgi:hypothetical protein